MTEQDALLEAGGTFRGISTLAIITLIKTQP